MLNGSTQYSCPSRRYLTNLILKQLKNFLIFLLLVTLCSGCSVVSKQWYYVPSTAHQSIKTRETYFKVVRQQFDIADSLGKPIGTLGTSNGLGLPLLGGPLFLAVFPVGLVNIFYKGNVQFEMDLLETPRDGYFMPLAIDSDSYKTTRDSLKALRIMTVRPLKTTGCYMIVNGTKKVPLHVSEYFLGFTTSHSYRLRANIRFAQVRTVTIVTGNPMLDRVLKNITFKRKSRIIFDELGES